MNKKISFKEDRQFFRLSERAENEVIEEEPIIYHEITASELVDEHLNLLKPEAQFQPSSFYDDQKQLSQNEDVKRQWKQCNSLGWSRQKEHLQRVQLIMVGMTKCENISITTVNSICAEAAFHKQDCSVRS